jgi:outer membrane biosynthesis protein TonB
MRVASLLLSALTVSLLAGCRPEPSLPPEQETAAADPTPARDLRLQTPAVAAVEVASAVELARPAAPPVATRPRAVPKPAPLPEPAPAPEARPAEEAVPAPVIVPAVAEVPAETRDGVEAPAAGGRELAPGKTVTVIPVVTGTSVEADEDDSWLPSERPRGILTGGGGGTCRPRGGVRGIGIAGRIPVGIPARRLR